MEQLLRRVWRLIGAAPTLLWGSALVVLSGILLWRARSELGSISAELRTAKLEWLIALLLFSILTQALNGLKLQLLLRRLGCAVPYPEVVSAQLQRQVILTVVPVGSAPSAVLFARRFARFGVTTPIMLMALMLFSLLGHGSFIAVLVPVFGWLAITGSLSTTVLIAAVALVVAVLVVSGVGLTTLRAGSDPAVGTATTAAPGDRVHRRGARDRGSRRAAWRRRSRSPISVDLLGIGMLWTALRSLDAPSSLEIAAGGYVIGTLFLMIAPLFQGIGIVEITMALALERLGRADSRGVRSDAALPARRGLGAAGRRDRDPDPGAGASAPAAAQSAGPDDRRDRSAQRAVGDGADDSGALQPDRGLRIFRPA